jgi:hypothetical protein
MQMKISRRSLEISEVALRELYSAKESNQLANEISQHRGQYCKNADNSQGATR